MNDLWSVRAITQPPGEGMDVYETRSNRSRHGNERYEPPSIQNPVMSSRGSIPGYEEKGIKNMSLLHRRNDHDTSLISFNRTILL